MSSSHDGVSALTAADGPRFIFGIDYGTTYTGIAWVLTKGAGEIQTLDDIKIIGTWPPNVNAPKVPSLFTYSANAGLRWGFGIADEAYVIRWTKMKLEEPTRLDALDALYQILDEERLLRPRGPSRQLVNVPLHLIQTSQDVVTDYLTETARWVRRQIEKDDPEIFADFPIDLVITHPAEWPLKSRSTTFKAVTQAFEGIFPELKNGRGTVRMATEPEACAQFTMRTTLGQGHYALRQGDCFMIVDAGGGTVDLVCYLVTEVSPQFRVTKITDVSGDHLGATLVDDYFLDVFLPDRLGEEYGKLLAFGGANEHGSAGHRVLRRGEQILLKEFVEQIKHEFAGPPRPGEAWVDKALDLPVGENEVGYHDNRVKNIRNGQLLITWRDMVNMYSKCISGIINLIEQQKIQVDRQRLRPGLTTIFLSGGFSKSPYLFSCVQQYALRYGINVLRGEDCWTAVCRGAVLMGLGIGCEVPPPMMQCPIHIGVVLSTRFADFEHEERQKYTDSFDQIERAQDNITWEVSRGDLITPTEAIRKSVKIVRKYVRTGRKTGTVVLLTSAYSGPEQMPKHYTKQNALQPLNLDFDLSEVRQPAPLAGHGSSWYRTETNPKLGQYQRVEMQLEITIDQAQARLELWCGKVMTADGLMALPGYCLAAKTIPFV